MLCKKLLISSMGLVLALAAGCGGGDTGEAPEEAAAPESYFEVDPATAATVTGKVNFEGDPPKMPPINMSAEPDCAQLHDHAPPARVVEVNDNGTLKNVFLWVKAGLEGKKFKPDANPGILDQKGCIYRPHVVALRAGQPIRVTNSDPTTHNVHPLPKVNREWNKSQSPGAPAIERVFARQEIMIPVKCNIHPWMRSYISVVDHPFYAVTAEDGSFTIEGLPPGSYTIEAIHERFGSQESPVEVGPSESKEIEFTYSAT